MSPSLVLALGATILAARYVGAQSSGGTVQDDWIFPHTPDYNNTLYVGQAYTLQWTSNLQYDFSLYCPACDTSNVALYASGGLDNSEVWQINSGISVQATKEIQWVVDVPSSMLADTTEWNLQFVPSGTQPSDLNQQISSPRIHIRPANVTTTSTTTISTATASPTSTTTNPSTGLSTGAKAGIGIGAALGGLAVIGAIIFGFIFAKRRNSRGRASSNAEAEQAPALGGVYGGHGGPPEYYEPKSAPYTPYNNASTPYGATGEMPVKQPTAEGLQSQSGPHELEHHAPAGELEATALAPQELPASPPPKP